MKKTISILSLIFYIAITSFAQSNIEKETLYYATKDGIDLQIDKYVETRLKIENKRPVMIYVHGGGFATGSSKNALQIRYSKHFASQGFVAFAINYRLGLKDKTQPTPDEIDHAVNLAVDDLIDATKFILENADKWNIDKNKIIISGGSAGAITCLTAEYQVANKTIISKKLPSDFNYAGVISQAGCVIAQKDSLIWNSKPCPILLMHGDKDQLVPFDKSLVGKSIYAGSNYLHNQFAKLNIPHWLYVETGADHIVALKPLQYNFSEIDNFIQKFVIDGSKTIIETHWKNEKPDTMNEILKVVPLYLTGWEKTDEEIEKNK